VAKQETPAQLVFKARKVLSGPEEIPVVKVILAQLVQLDNKVREAQLVIQAQLATKAVKDRQAWREEWELRVQEETVGQQVQMELRAERAPQAPQGPKVLSAIPALPAPPVLWVFAVLSVLPAPPVLRVQSVPLV